MSDENESDSSQIEIAGDSDLKEKLEAEDAKLDAEASLANQDEASASQTEERHLEIDQLPPASFTMLVQMFATQAMVALGVIPTPEGKQIQQLPLAKHFIDLLAVVEDKCRGNLEKDEEKLLDQSLYELRMTYVQLSSKPGKL